MPVLSIAQQIALARKHGFTDAELPDLCAVIMTESGGDTHARQATGKGRGLVQIDLGEHPDVTEAEAFDPDFALDFARRLSRNPHGFGAPNWYGPGDHPATAAQARADARAVLAKETHMALVRGGTVLPHVQAFADAVAAATGADSFGTYPGHDPTEDRAVDCFVPVFTVPLGTAIADFAIANMERYGIWYLIFRQRIYNPEIGSYWRPMEDRGSPTQNHFDHVHLSFYETAPIPPPIPPTSEEEPMSHVTVDPGERALIPVPVVNGGAGAKWTEVTISAPAPGAIVDLAQAWPSERKFAGVHQAKSFAGLASFALQPGETAVEVSNASPTVIVTVMVESGK